MDWKNNDELFIKELKAGHDWQRLAATYFELHGFDVVMPELTIRDSIKQAGDWIDSKDLKVNSNIIEVKSRNEIFSLPQYFPYDTVFIDTVAGYNAKKTKPLAYVMISRPTGAMLCLKTDNSDGWRTEEKFDRTRKINEVFYVCDKTRLQSMNYLLMLLKK